MKNKFKLLCLILFVSLTNFAQELKTFDKELLTNENKLNLLSSKKRGIETEEKEIYILENDNQTVSAYINGILEWQFNAPLECGKLNERKLNVRFIEIRKNKLFVTYGKHSFAEFNLKTGKTKCLGSD